MRLPQSADAALSPAELREALGGLSSPDLIRLRKIAAIYARGTDLQPDDVVQEAIRRALDGTRSCPRNVALLAFLRNAMRSIVSAARGTQGSGPAPCGSDAADLVPAPGHDPEQTLIRQEEEKEAENRLNAVLDLFKDDENALFVLMGDLDGLEAEEVRIMGDMDKTTYATVRRRIRRRIEREFAGGRNP